MYNLKINVTDLISSKKNWNWNVVSVFCFFGLMYKKKKKVCSRQRPLICFVFFVFFLIEENAFKYADRKRWSKQPPSIELCRSAWLALLSELCWNSPARSCFLCSLNSHFKSPKCSRIFGRGLFLGGVGGGHHVRPSQSGLICRRLFSFPWTARPLRSGWASQRVDSAVSSVRRERPALTFYLCRSQKPVVASCFQQESQTILMAADETDSWRSRGGMRSEFIHVEFVWSVKAKWVGFCFCLGPPLPLY